MGRVLAFLPLYTAALLCLVQCGQDHGPGSAADPVRFYFNPINDPEPIAMRFKEMTSFLEKETGYAMRLALPTSNKDIINSFGNGEVDIAILNSFGYLLAHENYGAVLRLNIRRDDIQTYRGMIITHADSDIENLSDLTGRSFAFTDRTSGSGYLMPLDLLKQEGVEIGNARFVRRHDNVVELVYLKQVAAGATFYSPPAKDGSIRDGRRLVMETYPDVMEKVRILAFTEPIPTGGVVFNKDMPEDMAVKLENALLAYIKTPRGREFFGKTYEFSGLTKGSDADYSGVRAALKRLEINPIDLIE